MDDSRSKLGISYCFKKILSIAQSNKESQEIKKKGQKKLKKGDQDE